MSGLDPAANRIAREQAQAKANQPPPLNPSFPYTVTAFDPWAFDLQRIMPPFDTAPEAVP